MDIPATAAYDENLPLDEVFSRYLAMRRLGPETRTVGNYRLAWNCLVAGLEERLGRPPVASDLSTLSLTEYLVRTQKAKGWSEQSTATYGGNIRSVASKAAKLGLLRPGVLAGFELPKVTIRDVVYFSDASLARIFDSLEADRTAKNLRLRAVANIMLDSGARPEEVAGLAFDDLDEGASRLRISGKGNKVRIVPVGATTWEFLRDYVRVRPAPASAKDPVFVDARAGTRRVAAGTLAGDARELLISVGLVDPDEPVSRTEDDAGYSLYTFRKTFAKRAAKTMDVGKLAAIMGHSPNSIPMLLQRYYNPGIEETQPAHAVARPADALHEWRASVGRRAAEAAPSSAFFDSTTQAARSTAGGNSPSSTPAWARRPRGAYRATSRATSQSPTGA